MSRLGI